MRMARTSAKTSVSRQSLSGSSASSEKAAGEIERLNKQVVAQAAELAAVRWELMALLKSRPVMRHVVGCLLYTSPSPRDRS